MSNRYLYKAKRKHDSKFFKKGEWVEGAYYIEPYTDKRFIIQWNSTGLGFNEFIEVDEESVCQYTGLKDKNGKLIWENDVVRFKHEKFDFDDGLEPWERSCLPNKKEYTRNYAVEFCNTSTNYGLRFRNKSIWFMVHRMTVVMHDVEVIGNIFDNPELMNE